MGCKQSRSKPFGGDLQILWAKQPEIPTILSLCAEFLQRPPASIENGLFRIPASRYVDSKPSEIGELQTLRQNPSYDPRVLSIKRYRSLTNVGRASSIPWSSIVDPLVVAGLYKLFFRQLNPPLLTYSLYDKWIAAQGQVNELAYVVNMRSLYAALPKVHQLVLVHALDLFHVLLLPHHKKQNNLTIEHLAHEFGPLFLRPLRSGEGANARYRDRGAQVDESSAVKCLQNLLTMREHIFERTNEEEFVRLSRDMATLRAKQIAHDQVMDEVKRQRDAHRNHKHAVICQQTQKNMLRRVVQQWKDNVNAIRGVTSVHSQHQAAQEQLLRMQERARTQHQTIQKLRIELEASTKRNEMLEIINGQQPNRM